MSHKNRMRSINISVEYFDPDGNTQNVHESALTFESAEEALGKLERFIGRLESEQNNVIEE